MCNVIGANSKKLSIYILIAFVFYDFRKMQWYAPDKLIFHWKNAGRVHTFGERAVWAYAFEHPVYQGRAVTTSK